MKKAKTYTYQIELSQPFYPRHIADMLTMQGDLNRSLISVTDLQRDDHSYGATYEVRDAVPAPPPLTRRQMIGHYQTLYDQWSTVPQSSPVRDAIQWILVLLSKDWVPGNMGMLTSYLKEFSIALEAFRAHCESMGKFAEEKEEDSARQFNLDEVEEERKEPPRFFGDVLAQFDE